MASHGRPLLLFLLIGTEWPLATMEEICTGLIIMVMEYTNRLQLQPRNHLGNHPFNLPQFQAISLPQTRAIHLASLLQARAILLHSRLDDHLGVHQINLLVSPRVNHPINLLCSRLNNLLASHRVNRPISPLCNRPINLLYSQHANHLCNPLISHLAYLLINLLVSLLDCLLTNLQGNRLVFRLTSPL